MKLYLCFFVLIFTLFSSSLFSMETGEIEPCVVGKARPPSVSNSIENCFESVARPNLKESGWRLYNGKPTYDHLDIDQLKLSRKIVEDALKNGEEKVAFLDVGAGNFQSCDAWAKYFNETFGNLPIKIHVVGIRGERSDVPEIETIGNCQVHKLGYFKIEDLQTEFTKRNIHFKFNLTISRWTMRHLVDPLGTFVQIFNRTAVNGLILMDWFYYLYEGEDFKTKYDAIKTSRAHLFDALCDIKHPFLIDTSGKWCSNTLDQFLLRKVKPHPLTLPLAYNHVEPCHREFFDLGSAGVLSFTVLEPDFKKQRFKGEINTDGLYGDLDLFHWLRDNKLTKGTELFEQLHQISPQGITPWRSPEEVKQGILEARKKSNHQHDLNGKIEETKKTFYSSLALFLKKYKKAPTAEGRSGMARKIEYDLLSALGDKNFEESQRLLDQGADVNRVFDFVERRCHTFLDLSAEGDLRGSMGFLLRNGGKTDHSGVLDNALYFGTGSVEDIRSLVQQGYVNQKKLDHYLFLCVWLSRNISLIDLFLSLGASLKTWANGHPLIYSTFPFNCKIWNHLVGKGAKGHYGQDLHLKGHYGEDLPLIKIVDETP